MLLSIVINRMRFAKQYANFQEINNMSTKELEKNITDDEVPVLRRLFIFNSMHFWDDVVRQLKKATGFDVLQCEQIAVIAHTTGKAVVKSGDFEELIKIDAVLKEINLITKII
jgi:ATP-dependent Clp protease adapter protein ClpS